MWQNLVEKSAQTDHTGHYFTSWGDTSPAHLLLFRRRSTNSFVCDQQIIACLYRIWLTSDTIYLLSRPRLYHVALGRLLRPDATRPYTTIIHWLAAGPAYGSAGRFDGFLLRDRK